MDIATQIGFFAAIVGGAVAMWLVMKNRLVTVVEGTVSTATTSLQVELGKANERIRSLGHELDSAKAEGAEAIKRAESLRGLLEEVKDGQSRLTERSSRVPILEAEVSTLKEKLAVSIDDARELSSSEAQKIQSIASSKEHLENLQTSFDALHRQHNEATVLLREETERRAALEEQATRLPVLKDEVSALMKKLAISMDEARELASSEAQKIQSIASSKEQLDALQSSYAVLQRQHNEATALLRAEVERRAALEEQAAQLPGLDLQLREAAKYGSEVNAQLTTVRETTARENGRLSAELTAERSAAELLQSALAKVKAGFETSEMQVNELTDQLTELRTRTDSEQKNASEKVELLLQAKDILSDQFKTLATEILEEKSKRFAEQNQQGLSQLLEPLKTKLGEFQGKVEEVYVNEGKDRSALSAQVNRLVELNQALSQDAKNLTRALKGSAKTQGNWGELILERVLEASGLRKGHEYHVQDSQMREDGSRGQADVIIDLPEDRKIVVDAKVSLVAYERYVSAESDGERTLALKQHLDSVRAHIKGLSDKRYQSMYGLKSLDFVLAFIPVEPAFMTAVTNDDELFMEAWNRNVLLVSPSTLLFVVRTVAHLWRQEAQSRNAQDIAKRGGELYDKLCGFVEDLETVGNRISQAQKAYDLAHGKLATGRGNVIRQAEMLRDLGVKPTKVLPAATVERAIESESDNIVVLAPLSAA